MAQENRTRSRAGIRLRSKRGASLALSLMLFLSCVSIGIVLITAATAATGILSGREELDRRYYCVTSAVELLRSRFDKRSYRVNVQITEIHYLENELGMKPLDPPPSYTLKSLESLGSDGTWVDIPVHTGDNIFVDHDTNPLRKRDYLAVQSLRVLHAMSDTDWLNGNDLTAVEKVVNDPEIKIPKTYSFTADSGGEALPGLKSGVMVTPGDRGIKIAVYNDEEEWKAKYFLTMDFSADVLKETTAGTTTAGFDLEKNWPMLTTRRSVSYTVNWTLNGISG